MYSTIGLTEEVHIEGDWRSSGVRCSGYALPWPPSGFWLRAMTWSHPPTTNHSVASRDLRHRAQQTRAPARLPASVPPLPGHSPHTTATRAPFLGLTHKVLPRRTASVPAVPPGEGCLASSWRGCFGLHLPGLAQWWPGPLFTLPRRLLTTFAHRLTVFVYFL